MEAARDRARIEEEHDPVNEVERRWRSYKKEDDGPAEVGGEERASAITGNISFYLHFMDFPPNKGYQKLKILRIRLFFFFLNVT